MAIDLGELAKTIDHGWRRLDAWMNRPLDRPESWLRAILAPEGYPWFVPVLMVLLVTALSSGPTLQNWGGWNIAVLLAGLAALAGLNLLAWHCRLVRSWLAAAQILLLAALSAIVWYKAGAGARQAEGGLYRHTGLLVAAMLAVALPFNWLVARHLFRPGGRRLREALPQVELFRPNSRYDFRAHLDISTLAIVPVRYPVALLLPGSLWTLWHPGGGALLWWFVVPNLVAAFLLVIGVLFERIMEMLRTVGRLFFVGPQLVLSIAIVVVTLLRLAGVHYVTYLFDSAGRANVTILAYVTLAYAVAWYYAFWSDQFAARRLIADLGGTPSGEETPGEIAYSYRGPDLTKVARAGRTIAQHGAGRLMVRGRSSQRDEPRFTFHTPQSLLEIFQRRLEDVAETRADKDPLPVARDLLRSSRVYPVITSLVAYGLIGGSVALSLYRTTQPAELEVDLSNRAAFDLESRLLGLNDQTSCGDDADPMRPRIAIAASGGGTRAALYTASLLQGLAAADRLCDVVLASGVSGGSAALAYLTSNNSILMRHGADPPGWQAFGDAMAEPYIQRVLDGVSELRVAFAFSEPRAVCGEPGAQKKNQALTYESWPSRTRPGQLLAESFVCLFGGMPIGRAPYGLILNTSLAGSLDGSLLPADETLTRHAWQLRENATDETSGGRLSLTNVSARSIATQPGEIRGMAFVALDGADIDVGRAAALSANFPPVFPNAAIDVREPVDEGAAVRRYWVTDGGAVENRATVTLLRSLLWTADRFCKPDGVRPRDCEVPPQIPDLHIIVADASAASGTYQESLGLGSALGAGAQLGLQLEHDLAHALCTVYASHHAKVYFHDLPMPTVLRSGGIGTHWMLPGKMTFERPRTVQALDGEAKTVELPAVEVERVVLDLHHPADQSGYSAEMRTLRRWIGDDSKDSHGKSWRRILDELTRRPPTDVCRALPGGAPA